jgi:hypothetical protein
MVVTRRGAQKGRLCRLPGLAIEKNRLARPAHALLVGAQSDLVGATKTHKQQLTLA